MSAANTTKSRAERLQKNKKYSKQRRDEIAYYISKAKQIDPTLKLTHAQASNLRIVVKYGNMTPEQGVRIVATFAKNVSDIRNAKDMKQWLTDLIKAMPIAAKLLEEMNAPPASTPAPPTDAAAPAPPAPPTPKPAPKPAPPADELKPLPSTEDPGVRASELDGFDFDMDGNENDMDIDDTFFEPTAPQLDYLDDFFDRADSADSDEDLEEYLDDSVTAPNYFKLRL